MTATLLRLAVIYLSATCGRADSNTGNFTSLLSQTSCQTQEWGCGGRQRVADKQKKKRASSLSLLILRTQWVTARDDWLWLGHSLVYTLGISQAAVGGSFENSGKPAWRKPPVCLGSVLCQECDVTLHSSRQTPLHAQRLCSRWWRWEIKVWVRFYQLPDKSSR